jgi:hypothetical protein
MRIITSALVVAATYNFAGCKDTPASLEKKLDALEAQMKEVEFSSSTIGRMRSQIKVAEGQKLPSDVRKATVEQIKVLKKSVDILQEIYKLQRDLEGTQDAQEQEKIRAKLQKLREELLDNFRTEHEANIFWRSSES